MGIITSKQAADRVGVSRQTISNWVKRGILCGKKTGRNTLFVDEKEVDSIKDIAKDVENAYALLKKEQYDIQDLLKHEQETLKDIRQGLSILREAKDSININFYMSYLSFMGETCITYREEKILEYFLQGWDSSMIADQFHLTRSRILQIANKAIRKIREYDPAETSRKLDEAQREINGLYIKVQILEAKIKQYNEISKNYADGFIRTPTDSVMRSLLLTNVSDLNLSVRATNLLRAARIKTVAELCRTNKIHLLHIRNFGKKTLRELDEFLEENGLRWGMNFDENLINILDKKSND